MLKSATRCSARLRHSNRARRLATGTLVVLLVMSAACTRASAPSLSAGERTAIADTLRRMIVNAYDLNAPGDAVARLMSLYPPSGTVISASGGRLTASRDTLERSIRAFWDNVGKNMQHPKWEWGDMHIDVLAADAATVTATYRVPHVTPRGMPHVIAGAWTAVFQRRDGKWMIVQEHLSDLPAPPSMPM
jgi:ketosteroid isomerase-like protein